MDGLQKSISEDHARIINEFQAVIREIMPDDASSMEFLIGREFGSCSISCEGFVQHYGGDFKRAGVIGSMLRAFEKYDNYKKTEKERALTEYEEVIEEVREANQRLEEVKAKLDALS